MQWNGRFSEWKKNTVRQILMIVVSILHWIFSVGYIREIYHVMLSKRIIKHADHINIDGSDFAPFANLAITGVNRFIIFLTIGSSVLFATIFILIFVILLRVTTIRKEDMITKSEVIFTRRLIIVSSVFAFLAGILSTNINLIGCVICLSWQQPLFMMLIYYLPLKNQSKSTE